MNKPKDFLRTSYKTQTVHVGRTETTRSKPSCQVFHEQIDSDFSIIA